MTFHVERESGNDWCIKDATGAIKASGLDLDEAETTCNQWNTKEQEIKKDFVDSA